MPATSSSPAGPAVLRPFRRYPLTAFVMLACLFGWAPYALDGSNPENTPYGPLLAVCIVVACQGRRQLASWGRSLLRWRARPVWYATAFLAPVAVIVTSVGANALLGASLPTGEQLGNGSRPLLAFLFMLFYVGVGEEVGWTFAACTLLRRHRFSTAYLLMTAIRVFWHVPLMLTGGLPWQTGVPGMIGFQLLLLLMMQTSRGPWTLWAVAHASLNAFGSQYFFRMVTGADNARLGALMGLTWLLAGAACLAWVARRRPDLLRTTDRPVTATDLAAPALVGSASGGSRA
jgi:hypothetical protein